MEDTRLREGFFAMVFMATGDTIKTEQEAKKEFQTAIIPTPREISKSCGLAIRFAESDGEQLEEFYERVEVPCDLYFLSDRRDNGKREASLLKHKE